MGLSFFLPWTMLGDRPVTGWDLVRAGNDLLARIERMEAGPLPLERAGPAAIEKGPLGDQPVAVPRGPLRRAIQEKAQDRLARPIDGPREALAKRRADAHAAIQETKDLIADILEYTRLGLGALLVIAAVELGHLIPWRSTAGFVVARDPATGRRHRHERVLGVIAGVAGTCFAGTLVVLSLWLGGLPLDPPLPLARGLWVALAGTFSWTLAGLCSAGNRWPLGLAQLVPGLGWSAYFAWLLWS